MVSAGSWCHAGLEGVGELNGPVPTGRTEARTQGGGCPGQRSQDTPSPMHRAPRMQRPMHQAPRLWRSWRCGPGHVLCTRAWQDGSSMGAPGASLGHSPHATETSKPGPRSGAGTPAPFLVHRPRGKSSCPAASPSWGQISERAKSLLLLQALLPRWEFKSQMWWERPGPAELRAGCHLRD